MTYHAWHFVRLVDGRPVLRDGRPMPEPGEWLVHEGEVRLCESGLHASWKPLDALSFVSWPDAAVCLVEVDEIEGQDIDDYNDKFVCRRRNVIAWAPADETLRGFARQCALSVLHLWDAPAVVREWLETGREEVRDAAGSAAWYAARSADWYTARSAAWSAARSATEDAAWSAARSATEDAAWSAARSATEDAAGYAARYAARSAAWYAAWSAQNTLLESMLLRLLDVDLGELS
jgi:hypothetical protein